MKAKQYLAWSLALTALLMFGALGRRDFNRSDSLLNAAVAAAVSSQPSGIPTDQSTVTKLGLNADLALTMTDLPDPVHFPSAVTYTLSVVNNGPDNAANVVVTDTLAAGQTPLTVTSSQGNCTGNSPITCNLGDLAAQVRAIITITARATALGSFTNRAQVTSATPDSNTANNTASEETRTATTVSIYGRVTLANGMGLGGVTVTSGNAQKPPVVTRADGSYQFADLPFGGTEMYIITPSLPGYAFNPPSQSRAYLNGDNRADFTVISQPLSISGRITEETGAGLAGLTVQLSSSGATQTETDADGFYIFNGLTAGRDYTVMPTSRYNLNDPITPLSINFTNLSENKTANFTGTRSRLPLSVQVTDANGNPMSGVTVTLTLPPGGMISSVRDVTDSQGNRSFGELPAGYSYTLQVGQAGVSFAPAERRVLLNRPLNLSFFGGVAPATAVAAASFKTTDLTSGGIVALFGNDLAEAVRTATGTPLPTELDGVAATLTVRPPNSLPCPLFFVSPQQINLLLPQLFSPFDAITGEALLTVRRNGRVVAAASLQLARVAPALFTANANGRGVAAAVVLRVQADGAQVFEPVAQFDAAQNRFNAVPIDVSNASEQVFLLLFGTGIRNRSSLAAVEAKLNDEPMAVSYAGAQGGFAGLDQINLRLLPNLAGRGLVNVLLMVEGKTANTVNVSIR